MNPKIKDFIKKYHLLSLSVVEADSDTLEVYSASCYYAFDEANLSLLFKSAQDSKHIQLCALNPKVAVIIAKDSKNLGRIQGCKLRRFLNERHYSKRISIMRAFLLPNSVMVRFLHWRFYGQNTQIINFC